MTIVVKEIADTEVGGKDVATRIYDPIDTLNRFLKLYQCLGRSFSVNMQDQFDVNLNDFRVIMMVGELGETASYEIADITGMPEMAISRTMSSLEQRGLIIRKIDSTNRRRKSVVLSADGKQLFEAMLPSSRAVANFLFDSLKLHEALSFDEYLTTLTERVTQLDEDGESVFLKATRPINLE